jgi:predicted enzyme related to lactoylglutathione lyase
MELSRVIIFTNDVDRLVDFYGSSFDLDIVGERDSEWTELNAGGCTIAFHRISENSQTRDGWVKIVFGAKDVAAQKKRLESLGVEMGNVVEFGNIQFCDGVDPDGNRFQISSRGID